MNDVYILEQNTGVMVRPGRAGIGYADGAERRLLDVMNQVDDVSTLSDDLLEHMTDWPTEYHLSRKRHLVLRPFNIKPGDRVLELGCGCGSITRYLGEIGAQVVAVEGELARAAVAARRCSEFSNVTVVADDFQQLELQESFDWVLMIGVLEYSQKYGAGNDRAADYLAIARRHLKPEGSLLIAIENKLGMKYINGAGEDHNGRLFYGVHDLYQGNDVTTWGRQELADMLSRSGFIQQTFYGAFPDYKLPRVVVHESVSQHRSFRVEELMLYLKSLDYRGQNLRIFDEALCMASMRKNGLVIDFANSFIVQARLQKARDSSEQSTLAHYFSVDRPRGFCTLTTFTAEAQSGYTVLKRPLETDAAVEPRMVFVTTVDGNLIRVSHSLPQSAETFHNGRLLAYEYSQAARRSDVTEMSQVITKWASCLVSRFQLYCRETLDPLDGNTLPGRTLHSVLIEGGALDCGPQNIVVGDSDDQVFDLEWTADRPIPLGWVLTRCANHIVRGGYSSHQPLSVHDVVGLLSDLLSLQATTTDIEEALWMESQLANYVGREEPSTTRTLGSALDYQ